MRSAQVSEDYPSPRRSSASSSVGYVPQRRFSQDPLASFDLNSSPTKLQLYELQIELDYQCLQLAAVTDIRPTGYPTSDVNFVVRIAVFLSSSLSLARFPGTFLFQEIQLRALVSCLALLHYHAVEALYPAQWHKLRKNVSSIFQQIAFQPQSKLTLKDAIRYAPNVYLVQLVSQYLSFIRLGDSKLPSVVGPIVKIFFAGVSLVGYFCEEKVTERMVIDSNIQVGKQYNHVLQLLEGLAELSSLWQTPQNKYKALCGLQEYTRLAASLCRESADALNPGQMREAAAVIVSALLEKVAGMLSTEKSPLPLRLGRQWPKSRTMIGLSAPDLNQGYYFLGLLDCAAQLAAIADPEIFRGELIEKVKGLVFESAVPEYRWKAIEILLSCSYTRTERSRDLRIGIEARSSSALKEILLEEVLVVQEILDDDEEAGLRLYLSQPLITGATQPLHGHAPDKKIIRIPDTPSIMSTGPLLTPKETPRTSVATEDWQKFELPRSRIKAIRSISVLSQRTGILRGRTRYDFAGLSGDCQHAFFYNANRVAVYRLADLDVQSRQAEYPRVSDFAKDFEPIFNVVMSQRFLVIVTSQCMHTIDIIDNYALEVIPHNEWEPNAVACYEGETQLMVALGGGQGNSLNSSKGQITLFKYDIHNSPKKLLRCSTVELPTQDRPKRVSLEADGRILTCVTTIQNKLLVWDLDERFSGPREPLEFVKNHYSKERYETGISSTSLFIAPSQRCYIFATTSPSLERHRNHGEWSFSLPLPSFDTPATPTLRPPSHTIHNFEQFQDHRALRAGAVSSKHNVFAVMEDTGRISLLPLEAADGGGIRGASDELKILEEWKGSAGGCLRFGPENEGGRLFAVDAKGKAVVVDFEQE